MQTVDRAAMSLVLALTVAVAGCEEEGVACQDPGLDLSAHLCAWTDHAKHPLIDPPPSEFLLGDPTVVLPAESPDGKWHLFANSLFGVHHHVSADGVKWQRLTPALFGAFAFRPYVYQEAGTYYLLFEKIKGTTSVIRVSTSEDLFSWTEPKTILEPKLAWEKELTTTVGNPYLTRRGGKYWLYYSASGVWLADAGVYEPKYIGLARADGITGPYVKESKPLISPAAKDLWRNLGAGSMKLLDERIAGKLIALNNGIYKDAAGKNRSAILVMSSDDGLAWQDVCPGAALAPTGAGWKKALVYAFDTARVGDEIWVYYNGRDGWAPATERIGLSMLSLPCQ